MFKRRAQAMVTLMLLFTGVSYGQPQSGESDASFQSYEGVDTESTTEDGEDIYKQNFTLEEGQDLPRSSQSKSVHEEIERVLSSEDFASKETVTRWRWIRADDKAARKEKYPEWLIDFMEWFESRNMSMGWLASLIEVLLWALLAGLIVFVLFRYRAQIKDLVSNASSHSPEAELPTTLFGLDVKKDSLPKDVVASAKQIWISTGPRQAVAVLLRASLIKLLHEYGCRFFDSDTEEECCERIAQQAPKNFSTYMWSLVGVWQRVAYAHIDPSEVQFSALCEQWSEVFSAK